MSRRSRSLISGSGRVDGKRGVGAMDLRRTKPIPLLLGKQAKMGLKTFPSKKEI